MRRLTAALVLLALPALAAAPPVPETPLPELPYTPGLNPAFLDKTVDPCVDFFKYSCGGWMKANPIPADQSNWSVYGKLGNEVQRHLWSLLEESAHAKDKAKRSPREVQVGDYFAACMDEPAVERRGATPLKPSLDALAAVNDAGELARWLAQAHLAVNSGQLLFGFGSDQDAKHQENFIPFIDAGGLGLPDREDYLSTDAKSVSIRAAYELHLEKLLTLLGDSPDLAKRTVAEAMRIETTLAKSSLTRAERRDPVRTYNRMDPKGLAALAPAFDWSAYLAASQAPVTPYLNVTQPKFLTALNALLKTEPLEVWKRYLRLHLLNINAPALSKAFVSEDFQFYRKTLRGDLGAPARWKRCMSNTQRDLGEALGQIFVEKDFSPAIKARAVANVKQVQAAMEKELQALSWMSDATKKEALLKLHGMANKIGYPNTWRDYSALQIGRDDFFKNYQLATRFESLRQLRRIGRPVDRGEWLMTPQTVDAYYSPQMNDMNFPAAALLPPLFDPKMDDAPNYGNTGGTVGHEMTHGFDDEGRQFDAKGNLRDWWTPKDAAAFKQRAQCVSDQFSTYFAVDDIKVNGALTLGENVADLGGLILAYQAWKTATEGQRLVPIDGLTPAQRFFVGNAQWACNNIRPEAARLQARVDPHAPARYRVNGLVVNVPEFQTAFACKAGQPMVKAPEKLCKVW